MPYHFQIIRIFDVFIPDGNQETMTNIYIVMEYMEHSLRDVSDKYLQCTLLKCVGSMFSLSIGTTFAVKKVYGYIFVFEAILISKSLI